MNLEEIQLHGQGRFLPETGGFEMNDFRQEREWFYIYTTDRILLRVSNLGIQSVQINPPGGIMLFNRKSADVQNPLQIYIRSGNEVFTAFPGLNSEAKTYRCSFFAEKAVYFLEYDKLAVETTVSIGVDQPSVLLQVKIRNTSQEELRFDVTSLWNIAHCKSMLAPWDLPSVYQSVGFFNDAVPGVFVQNRDPEGRVEEHIFSAMFTSLDIDEAEVCYRQFTGNNVRGLIDPAGLYRPLSIRNDSPHHFLDFGRDGSVNIGMPGVAAMKKKDVVLAPGEELAFSNVILTSSHYDRERVSGDFADAVALLAPERQAQEQRKMLEIFQHWTGRIQYDLPDKALQQYLEKYLPWQLYFVGNLDRGWPTGMRGTRDSAQDYSGIAIVDAKKAGKMLKDIFCCQKSDGGFLRQYSTSGPRGKHDTRNYVDSGIWVMELLYDYLRYTGDVGILKESCRTLDHPEEISIATHVEMLLNYYLNPGNRGEHGLILIHEGDWNDAINNAGLKGIGESVMVSCQVILILEFAKEIFKERKSFFEQRQAELRRNIRTHALNGKGFLNGVFNDERTWLFSARDADGECRVNVPVNSFGIIAGVFEPSELPEIFRRLKSLKGPYGYRLFYPPLGKTRIACAGRLGTGDLAAGMYENGTVYNHGSQGFLLRAACRAKQDDMVLDVLKYALPFDQDAHDVRIAKSEPYGVVNWYSENPSNAGEGGSPFLSGTISTLFRAFLEGVIGFVPSLDTIRISPCLPREWSGMSCRILFRGKKIAITITRASEPVLYLNGVAQRGNEIPIAALNDETVIEFK